MADVIEDLKTCARRLHRRAAAHDSTALARLRQVPELNDLADIDLADAVKRRHCLTVVAREIGFAGWPHAVSILSGKMADDFGTLLYPRGAEAYSNIWSASYEEARAIRAQNGGYLLAYRRHFFIADRYFVENLGLDPDDADWEHIGRDWVHPIDRDARSRLYAHLIRCRVAS